jgi:hypothetical protein
MCVDAPVTLPTFASPINGLFLEMNSYSIRDEACESEPEDYAAAMERQMGDSWWHVLAEGDLK